MEGTGLGLEVVGMEDKDLAVAWVDREKED